ncbi:hypothetical protein MRX96_009846 [Rhipicephalus microplus]
MVRGTCVLAGAGLAEEHVEGVVTSADRFAAGDLAARLQATYEAIQFPAGIAELDARLSYVNRYAFS